MKGAISIELLAVLVTIVVAVAGTAWSAALYFAGRFREMENKILDQVSKNRRNSEAQFNSIGLRLLRLELVLKIDRRLPLTPGPHENGDHNGTENGNGNGQ